MKGVYIEREEILYQNGKGVIKLLIIEKRDTITPISIDSSNSSFAITIGIIPMTIDVRELDKISTK